MPDTVYFAGFLVVSALVMLILLIRGQILVRGALFSALTGAGTLWGVSLLSGALGLGVTCNVLSVAVSVIYGLPGVVGLLLLRLLLR